MKDKKNQQLEKAKKEALKNPPKELERIVINTSRSKEKKSSINILMDMRYGTQG